MRHQVPDHPHFRPGTVDREIWVEAVELNTYRLPPLFDHGDNVLDCGAHTGSVAWRCAVSGASVVAVEPSSDNFRLLLHNLDAVKDRVLCVNAGVWRSDRPACVLPFARNWQVANTGGGCTMSDGEPRRHDALGIPLDTLLQLRERWRLVKLDCEGAEMPAILTSRELGRVQAVTLEYHERTTIPAHADCGLPFTAGALADCLRRQGFEVEEERKGSGMGLLHATRLA